MRKFFKRLHNRRAFTLLECVLAVAILAALSAVMLPLITTGSKYIMRSKNLDSISSLAQSMVYTMQVDPDASRANDVPTMTTLQNSSQLTAFLGRNEDSDSDIFDLLDGGVTYGYTSSFSPQFQYTWSVLDPKNPENTAIPCQMDSAQIARNDASLTDEQREQRVWFYAIIVKDSGMESKIIYYNITPNSADSLLEKELEE